MPAKLSRRQETQIIRLYFEGYSNAEIAADVGCSTRTVRDRISNFKKLSKEVGIRMAALNMEVSVEDLYLVAQYKKEKKVEFDEIWDGMYTASITKELGCDPNDARKFLGLVSEEIKDRKYAAKDFARNAYALRDTREKLGKPYEKALSDHTQLIADLVDIQYSIKNAGEEKKLADEELENSLKKQKTSLELLEKYVHLRDSLKPHGIDIDDVDKLVTLLQNLQEYYETPLELVEYYGETKDAKTRHQNTVKEIEEHEETRKELIHENQELDRSLDEKHTHLEIAEIFMETGITPGEAVTLSTKVKQIAARNSYPITRAFNKLCQDLEDYYDPALGYEKRLSRLKEEHESKQRLFTELETSYNRRLEENQNQLDAIKNLRTLNSMGVGNQDLHEWTRILDENNLDSHTLRREIKKLDGIKPTINMFAADVTKLNRRKQELGKDIQRLEERQKQLDSYVAQIEGEIPGSISIFAKTLTTYIDIMEDEILSPKTGIKPRTNTLVQETMDQITKTLQHYDEEWKKHHQNLADKIEESAETVARLEEKSYEAGKIIGEVIHLESILKLCQDKQLSKIEANIAVYSIAIALQNHLNKRNLPRSRNKVQELIETFSNEVKYID